MKSKGLLIILCILLIKNSNAQKGIWGKWFLEKIEIKNEWILRSNDSSVTILKGTIDTHLHYAVEFERINSTLRFFDGCVWVTCNHLTIGSKQLWTSNSDCRMNLPYCSSFWAALGEHLKYTGDFNLNNNSLEINNDRGKFFLTGEFSLEKFNSH